MNDNIFFTTYKKNLGRNYMIVDTSNKVDINKNCFRTRMIHENNIGGLLNTYVQYVDDIPSFQYDITGLQSLEVMLDTSPITYSVLCKIFSGIYNSLISLENYLLVHDHVMLLPEYIYVTADYSDISLCYYPLKNSSFVDSIRSFFDYILKRVDHNDEKCVFLAYSMHRYCNDASFNLNTLYAKLSSTMTTYSSNMQNTSYDTYKHVDLHGNEPYASSSLNEYEKNTFEESPKPDSSYSNFSFKNNEDAVNCKSFANVKVSKDLNANDKGNKKVIDKRIIFLISFIVVGLSVSTMLYVLELFNFSFYATLLATVLIIACYNGYQLYRQQRSNSYIPAYEPVLTIEKPSPNTGTVLLAASMDERTHKLIYTGTAGDGTDISLTHFPFVIGKTDSCSAKLQNSVISRIHAKLSLLPTDTNEDDIFIEDLNSTNGTLLNNVPLTPYKKYPVTSGDYITFGHLTYIFQ